LIVTSIPRFPDFRSIEREDRTAIEHWFRACGEPSDFGFSSLFAWNGGTPGGISLLGGNLVVRFRDYCAGDLFYSFIGRDAVVESACTLLAHARGSGLAPRLKLVPEAVVAADPRFASYLTVVRDRANFDYVYDVDDWASFTDPRLGDNRRLLRRVRERSAIAARAISVRGERSRAAIVDLFHRWASGKASPEEAHRSELTALRRVLSLDHEGVEAQGCFAGDRLVGFLVWEALPGGVSAVAHFQKSDRDYPGLSVWQVHALGLLLQERGIRCVNFEQDLGIPGLRRFKQSLGPSHLLRKYVVSPRESADR
jgi:hypothetical protein